MRQIKDLYFPQIKRITIKQLALTTKCLRSTELDIAILARTNDDDIH